MSIPTTLSWIHRLESLRAREHECRVEMIGELARCLRTRAHLDLGYPTLWKLLVERLGYSEGAASRRASAAKVVARCPAALGLLRARRVTLCALARLAAVIDEVPSLDDLLSRIEGKGLNAVDREIAALRPVPRTRETVRRRFVGGLKGTGSSATSTPPTPNAPSTMTAEATPPTKRPTSTSPPTSTVEVGGDDARIVERVLLSFDVDPETFAELERVKRLLSSKYPCGPTLEQVMHELIRLFLDRKDPVRRQERRVQRRERRTRETEAPATSASDQTSRGSDAITSTRTSTVEVESKPRGRSRHIPAELRDHVLARDGMRCTWVSPEGHRCDSAHDLQIDHVRPFALGGAHMTANLRVLCAAHNRHRAKFWMACT